MFDKYKIGDNIARLRKKQGLTGEKLAELLDVSPQAVSKWENGRCLPETALLLQMSKILKVSVDNILNPQDISAGLDNDRALNKLVEERVKEIDGLNKPFLDGGAPYGLNEHIQTWAALSHEAKIAIIKHAERSRFEMEIKCGACRYKDTLCDIVREFAQSGWDILEGAANAWLTDCKAEVNKQALIRAVRLADEQCGGCGCEYDPLYKAALEILCG